MSCCLCNGILQEDILWAERAGESRANRKLGKQAWLSDRSRARRQQPPNLIDLCGLCRYSCDEHR